MNATKQHGGVGRLIQPGWTEGLPRPHVAPPGPKSWALSAEGACKKLSASAREGEPFDIDDAATDPEGAAFAKSICAGCPLRIACLDYALANEPFGIYGGLDAVQRRALRGAPMPFYEERREAARIRRMFAQGMTAAQVAAHYGVSRRTIERWRRAAGLVAPRAGQVGDLPLAA